MTSVDEIERTVAQLPPEDLAAFRAWFERFEADHCDRHIDEGVALGRLDRVADEAVPSSVRVRCESCEAPRQQEVLVGPSQRCRFP